MKTRLRFFLLSLTALMLAGCDADGLSGDNPNDDTLRPSEYELYYKSSDGNIIKPGGEMFADEKPFGEDVTIVSNTIFADGRGVITFNKPVKKLDYGSFTDCPTLTEIVIPTSVNTIGYRAFYRCENLVAVVISDSVVYIQDEAFEGCRSLSDITIPEGVSTIGDWAFRWCESLTEITIPESVRYLGEFAFYGCYKLEKATILEGLAEIRTGVFGSCLSLAEMTIPNSVTEIWTRPFFENPNLKAFYGKFASDDNRCLIVDNVLKSFAPSGLTSYVIPDDITAIDESVFASCDNLESVIIGGGVARVGKNAFMDCSSLANLVLGENITYIDENAFNGCGSLTDVKLPDGLIKIGTCAFLGCQNITSIIIPDSVKSVEFGAFWGCNLAEFVIGSGIEEIGSYAFEGSGTCAYCKAVTPPAYIFYEENSIYPPFLFDRDNFTLYVPTESVEAYRAHEIWGYVYNIEGYDFSV